MMLQNQVGIRGGYPQQYHHVVGKTLPFTPDEANVDDLVRACALPIIYSVY